MTRTDLTHIDDVEVLVAFLNTFHVELDRESLTTPADLARWAREHRLGAGLGGLDESDLAAARLAREALRAHLAEGPRRPGSSALARMIGEVRLAPTLDERGLHLAPTGTGWSLLWGRLVVLLHQAQAGGRLSRLKVCPGENCAWAFHDRSKNGSRTWCSEQVCGARTRSRNYRRRRRSAG
ncbi:MAG TPA: CGNR zinc finger domain-containing protein [Nocardioidaceae bacterium]|jgi:predicted RNA-binding Zn ribbon-like protein